MKIKKDGKTRCMECGHTVRMHPDGNFCNARVDRDTICKCIGLKVPTY